MLAFINGLSPMHVLVVLVVALLLFGNRLPDIARSLGRSLNEFKKGMREMDDELNDKSKRDRLDSPRTDEPKSVDAKKSESGEAAVASGAKHRED